MKRVGAIAIMLSALALAAGIDGKWISERQVGSADGKQYSHKTIFDLKQNGEVLTGTITLVSAAPWMGANSGRAMEISDGKVEGDKFSFKIKQETTTGEHTVVYEGTIEGDHLKGVTKFRGIGQSWEFVANREK